MSDLRTELVVTLNSYDMANLCQAASDTMLDTTGFSIGSKRWQPPSLEDIENYFRGVMLIQERKLFVAKLDGTVCGSVQLLLPSSANQTSDFAVTLDNLFVAPWARDMGFGKMLLEHAENFAKENNFILIKLSVRSNREAAIDLFEKQFYKRWGTLEKYEKMGNQIISGFFYSKDISVK